MMKQDYLYKSPNELPLHTKLNEYINLAIRRIVPRVDLGNACVTTDEVIVFIGDNNFVEVQVGGSMDCRGVFDDNVIKNFHVMSVALNYDEIITLAKQMAE